MNCLKCPNFWNNDINEEVCSKCGCEEPKEEEEESK